MRKLLAPFRRWLASRPHLRRRLTLIIYRFPALDMRLRGLLHSSEPRGSAHPVDAAHLPESARAVVARLRARMPRP